MNKVVKKIEERIEKLRFSEDILEEAGDISRMIKNLRKIEALSEEEAKELEKKLLEKMHEILGV